MPQAGHQLIDGMAGLRFREGRQMSVDGSGGGRGVSQVTLDNA